jgi:hypothetical protein
MKSDDLRTHSGEGKIDLKTDLKIFSFLFSLIFLSNLSFAQIPINGFTNFSEIEIIAGQNRFFSLNYNKDSYSDLLVYNQENKTAYLLTGQSNLKFSKPHKLFFRFEPNFFKAIYNSQNQIIEYAFSSRKSRIFGLINFNQYGYPRISKTIKMSSYPNKIDVADVDLDNSNDYLISGEAFEGLSIISERNNQLVEKKLSKNHSFLDAFFFDINGDEYVDILAYDLISQNLFFIYNKDGERFQIERELSINQRVNRFQIIDINFDGYKDLIFSTDNGLMIYYGDNLSVFNQSVFIRTSSAISNFTVGDFNHDGSFDIICQSFSGNYLSVLFAKNTNEFFEEIIFDFGSQIEELIPFFSRFIYGVASLSKNGKIKIVSEFASFNKDVNLIYGIKPFGLQTFDLNNNSLLDFIFIDRFDNKLKFILRNNRGIPSQFFQLELKGFHSEIFILRKSVSEIILYCYSLNERLIEIIEIDFNSFTFKKDFVYAEGKIQDLWSSNVNGSGEIKILYSKGNELNYGILKLSLDKKYNLIKYPLVTDNFLSANILSENENKILYWNKKDSSYTLNSVNYLFDSKQEKKLYSVNVKEDIKLFNCIPKLVKNYDYFSSLMQISDKKYLLIFSRDFNILIKSELLTNHSLLSERPLISDNEGFRYFYDSELNQIFRIIYVKRMNKLIIRPVFEDVKVSEFAVSKLDKTNKHLIFIDSYNQKIKVRQLN